MIWTMEIPGWRPVEVNKLLGNWRSAGRLKGHDREIVGRAVRCYHVSMAQARRKVFLHVVWPKGTRSTDPDSLQKSLLDALVHAGALKNDSHLWCEFAPPTYSRTDDPEGLRSFITIQEMP